MKRVLPDRVELTIFATLAILCAAVVSLTSAQDLSLSIISVPVFIASALMGMRRSGQLGGVRRVVSPPSSPPPSQTQE